ncbi:hypothetical protein [Mycobacterium sp. C31M]
MNSDANSVRSKHISHFKERDITMRKIFSTTVMSLALMGAAATVAPFATAAPAGPQSATETVNNLRAQGYNVQVNGTRNGPLSNCSVDSVRGPSTDRPGETVYVDLSCPFEYQY